MRIGSVEGRHECVELSLELLRDGESRGHSPLSIGWRGAAPPLRAAISLQVVQSVFVENIYTRRRTNTSVTPAEQTYSFDEMMRPITTTLIVSAKVDLEPTDMHEAHVNEIYERTHVLPGESDDLVVNKNP